MFSEAWMQFGDTRRDYLRLSRHHLDSTARLAALAHGPWNSRSIVSGGLLFLHATLCV